MRLLSENNETRQYVFQDSSFQSSNSKQTRICYIAILGDGSLTEIDSVIAGGSKDNSDNEGVKKVVNEDPSKKKLESMLMGLKDEERL